PTKSGGDPAYSPPFSVDAREGGVDINELEFSGQIVARDPRGHDDEQAQKGTCDARRPSRTNIAGDQPRVWNGPPQVLDVPLPFQGVKDGERDGLNSSGRVGLQSHQSVVEHRLAWKQPSVPSPLGPECVRASCRARRFETDRSEDSRWRPRRSPSDSFHCHGRVFSQAAVRMRRPAPKATPLASTPSDVRTAMMTATLPATSASAKP